jgi:hypothetical protein
MKLFTKDIDKKLFAQFEQGSDLENQMVVAKIFNPYGRGVWYIINSDPSDPDYLWAIVDLFEVEAGSVSRSELESIKVPPFRLPLERDMYFTPINAAELYRGLLSGKRYAEGGEISIEAQNKDMLLNYAEELEHHVKEFEEAAKKAEKVMPWVIAKIERSSTDLSDVTHYLASENEKRREYGNGEGEEEYADGGEVKWQDAQLGDSALVVSENKMGLIIKPYGRKFHLRFPDGSEKTYDASELKFFGDMDDFDRGGKMASGGRLDVGRYYKTTDGRQVRYLGDTKDPEVGTFTSKADGVLKVRYDEIQGQDSLFAEGGEMEEGVDLFEDYDNIPSNVQEVLDNFADAFEDGNYKELEKANKELGKIGYTFEYGLDGQAYDLRKVGEKGKSEYMAKGGKTDSDEVVYIEFLNAKKGFSKDKKYFRGETAYNDAVKWGRKNIGNFNMDMVKFEMADGGMMAKGGKINLGDVVEVKEPNYGYDDSYYVVDNKAGYDKNGFLISATRKRVGDVFEKEQLRKLYGKGGYMAKGDISDIQTPFYFKSKIGIVGMDKNATFQIQDIPNYGNIKVYYYDGILPRFFWIYKDELEKRIGEGDFIKSNKSKFQPKYASGGKMAMGGKIYKIQSKDKNDIIPKWKDDTWYTNGKKYLSYKDSQNAVKKLQGDNSLYFMEFRVVEDKEKMAMGGKVKFADKVKSIKKSLLERKKVSPKVQKDYGKTYSPKEAEESAKRIVGAMTAKERLMAKRKKSKK